MKDTYILDACSLIAFFGNEKGSEKVDDILRRSEKEDCLVFIHKINLFEVYYDSYRRESKKKANDILITVNDLPITIIEQLEDKVFKEAGRLKATYRISLADSIALAEAKTKKAEIVTADHHEFDIIEKKEKIKFFWIR
ncbi:MAG: type II toxin-antitoxin system VapC family toxin [Cytophagales bacterium]|nr:type II toxin-antitoxin system VapC family toxin [Cytophagales bacterium]